MVNVKRCFIAVGLLVLALCDIYRPLQAEAHTQSSDLGIFADALTMAPYYHIWLVDSGSNTIECGDSVNVIFYGSDQGSNVYAANTTCDSKSLSVRVGTTTSGLDHVTSAMLYPDCPNGFVLQGTENHGIDGLISDGWFPVTCYGNNPPNSYQVHFVLQLPPTATDTPVITDTPTQEPTNTPTSTVTNTPILTATPTDTPVPPTATDTAEPPTDTPIATSTNTSTDVPLPTVTKTSTTAPTDSPTVTQTTTAEVPTSTGTATATLELPTATETPQATNTLTPSNTPTETATAIPSPTATSPQVPVGISRISASGNHTCAIETDSTVRCWGQNSFGELGDGTFTDRSVSVQLGTLTNVVSVSTGEHHSCALETSGDLYCWGLNSHQQVGKATDYLVARPLLVRTGIKSVAAGQNHTCAVHDTGDVVCWGDNSYGQLGNGTNANMQMKPVTGLSDVLALASGESHTCALLSNGTVACWGDNTYDQINPDNSSYSYVPVPVANVQGAIAITAGANHTCALLTGGNSHCWGDNSHGQLGDDSLTNVISLDAGLAHTCALTGDGLWKCWGDNSYVQLGDSTQISGAYAIAAGEHHSCALLSDGDKVCWGSNALGQLGDGSLIASAAPVYVKNPLAAAKVGGIVYSDLNKNGNQDDHEPGVAGIIVTLSDANQEATKARSAESTTLSAACATITDQEGRYVCPMTGDGLYRLDFADPIGAYVFASGTVEVPIDAVDQTAPDVVVPENIGKVTEIILRIRAYLPVIANNIQRSLER